MTQPVFQLVHQKVGVCTKEVQRRGRLSSDILLYHSGNPLEEVRKKTLKFLLAVAVTKDGHFGGELWQWRSGGLS